MNEVSNTVLDYIYKNWPVVIPEVPEQIVPVNRGFGRNDGICSHPDFADDSWVHSRGGERFALGITLPDNFFWMGVQNRGGSEYFFLMWYRNSRRFWFYDQYVVYYANSKSSPKRTLEHLNSALEVWTSTTDDVVSSLGRVRPTHAPFKGIDGI